MMKMKTATAGAERVVAKAGAEMRGQTTMRHAAPRLQKRILSPLRMKKPMAKANLVVSAESAAVVVAVAKMPKRLL
jgi:hypothetical protein